MGAVEQRCWTKAAENNSPSRGYLPFLDGLRAVAVLLVVLFHAGISTLSGGYIGVDVFFVISGFLIIGQILKGINDKTFDFADFWSRRTLRIIPPYLLVILVAGLIAPFVLVLPAEYESFGEQVLWSAGMVANHYFLGQQGYFDTAAEVKPLLHLWSLAVEEQFYLLAPVLLVGLACSLRFVKSHKFRAQSYVAAYVALLVLSFSACVYWTNAGDLKNYSFFIMPLRAWEFLIGGCIAAVLPIALQRERLVMS